MLCALLVTVTLTDLELRVIPNAILVGRGRGRDRDRRPRDRRASLPENLVAAAIGGGILP